MDKTVGRKIKATFPCDGKRSVQFQIGEIIYVGRRALVQFDKNVCGHNGNGIGKPRHCWLMDLNKITLI